MLNAYEKEPAFSLAYWALGTDQLSYLKASYKIC